MDPDWYKHDETSFKTYTIYDLTTNEIARHDVLNVSSLKKQPEYNIDKNCTALLVGHHLTRFSWIVIPCDLNITATYFCQSKLLLPVINFGADLNPLNSTCDQGWLMMEGRPVCYRLMKPDRAISFSEGERACSSRNSSIYRVNLNNEPPVDDMLLKKWFLLLYGYNSWKNLNIDKKIRHVLFGRLLNSRLHQNILPGIVISQKYINMPILATGTDINRCGIIESLTSQSVLRNQNGALHDNWFFKQRPCSKIIDIISLICEKSSEQYKQTCSSFYFQCSDGTCLLLIYACDMVYDCFDGSDETGCSYNITDTVTLQTTAMRLRDNLPCTLDYNCLLYTKVIAFPLPVHSVCDGIYSTKWFDEKNLCNRNKRIIIQLSYMIGVEKSRMRSFTSTRALLDLFRRELIYIQKSNSSYKHNKIKHMYNSSHNLVLKSHITNCHLDGKAIDINRMCKITAHEPPCKITYLSKICTLIWCPGMFKCIHTYCLPMSVICNGHQECPDGEDELYCFNLVCPGLLKCRGENRCVSTGEICDGKVNCQYSFDDEIMCETCPIRCICSYYFMSCADMKNTLPGTALKKYPYVKGISFKGRITNITIEYFVSYLALIYIDISQCGIERIAAFTMKVARPPNILFLDVKYNDIINTSFLSSSTLSKLVSMDLSHNKITHINSKFIKIYYFKLLRIGGNPLMYIYFDFYKKFDDHRIIDISLTEYFAQMNIYINTPNLTSILVRVTDPFMCCTLKTRCKLLTNRTSRACFQLIKDESLKYIFYFVSTTAFAVSLTRLLVIIYRSILLKKHPNPHDIMRINQALCALLMCIYFTSIFINNALNNNVILWRKSVICRTMSVFLYMTLINNMVFKSLSVIILSLKIKFPFEYQCRWLKFSSPVAVMTWLCSLLFVSIVSLSIIVDRFCTYGECSSRTNKFVFIYLPMIIIDIICICSSLIVGIQSFLVLKRRTIQRQTTSSQRAVSGVEIMFKVGRIFYIELVFRFLLYILFIANLTEIRIHEKYCFIVFLLLQPMECIVPGVIEFMM